MATQPRKPWRVATITNGQHRSTDHATPSKAYARVTKLRQEIQAGCWDVSRITVHAWTDGIWSVYEDGLEKV
ncbi:hypothetical protein OH810_31625 (plasmid) [Streptomyces albidoflavus]|uniref:PCQ3_73 n=1 Tax=Streptomyces sp. W9 TaxID=682410 RepID=D0UZC2_9ACTN|nr:hypothetical protein [Streptomyces sp. W9]ACX85574.1 pCQ3_73 [Streptomyces sp. W9]WTC46192.1 hypothetical protein OH810_31625 [Streptomyces albidoflavus]